MSFSKHYVLAAGGTGGHMIPAYALARELVLRGHRVALITDARGEKIPGMVEEGQVHVLPAGRITKDPRSWPGGVRAILKGRRMAMQLYETFQPAAVVGFGGYPAYPALLAANSRDIPTIVHEQNAVLGRVNRLAARSVNAIATAYPDVLRIKPKYQEKVHLVGNPVREEVVALRDEPYPPLSENGIFRVLVTGGSQGASILSDVVPDAMAMLPMHLRRRLQITQQCREDDIERVRAKYAEHRRSSAHSGAIAQRDGRSPDLQRQGNGCIRRRACDPAGALYRQGTGQADAEDGAAARRAGKRRALCGKMRAARGGQ